MSLRELGRRVAAEQDERIDASDALGEVRARIATEPLPKRRTGAVKWAAALAVAAALIVVITVAVRSRPLTFSVAGEAAMSGVWISAEPSAVTAVRFSDGSFFALRDEARARVESVTSNGAHLVVERGTVAADVVHTATSQWLVLAGPYEIRVTGTQFDVSWEPDQAKLDVHVTRGSVRVTGASTSPRDVHTGETYTLENREAERSDSRRSLSGAWGAEPPISTESGSAQTSPTASSLGRWRELAAKGRYSDAFDLLQRSGIDEVIATSSPQDLMTLADTARFTAHADIAQKSLVALRHRFPKDTRVSRAAFDLGRLAFDQQHDYTAAATWFATCLTEDPNGPLDREAAGRLVEARHHASDIGGARSAASDYLRRYPDGPHAPLAKSILQE